MSRPPLAIPGVIPIAVWLDSTSLARHLLMQGLHEIPPQILSALSDPMAAAWLWLMREGQHGERNHRWRMDYLSQVADSAEMQSETRYRDCMIAGVFVIPVKRTAIPPFEKSWARLLRSITTSVDPDHLLDILVSLFSEQAFLPKSDFPLGQELYLTRLCWSRKRRKLALSGLNIA